MNTSFLKENRVAPRRNALLNRFPGNLRADTLDAFLCLIWNSLQAHLADPIQVVETDIHRTVTFMGCIRYAIEQKTGRIHVAELQEREGVLQFTESQKRTAVGLPLKLTGYWLDVYLVPWQTLLVECLIDHYRPGPGSWHQAVKQELIRALRLSSHWRKLRHAVRDTLGLDRELLNWIPHEASDEEIDDILSNHYGEIEKMIYDRLERYCPGVTVTE